MPDLAVVPGGGTNVFARALGVPRDPVEATGALLDALREHRRRSIGLGLAGDRWFTFNAGMGWDAEVVARVDRRRRSRPPGRHTTPTDYVRAALAQFFLHTDRRHPVLTLERPGQDPVRLHMAIVANTAPWTYLGRPAAAHLARGVLRHRPRPLRPDPAAHAGHPRRGTAPAARPVGRRARPADAGPPEHDVPELTLRASRPVAAQVDGEALGDLQDADAASVPNALRVVV